MIVAIATLLLGESAIFSAANCVGGAAGENR